MLHSDLTADDLQQIQQKVPEAEILGVSIDETFFQNFPETDRYPRQIYYRIFAAQFLPAELDRVLYLDTDTIAIQPLDDLYYKAFDGASYVACTHVRALFNKMNCLRLGIAEDVPYINTGVMVMNLKQLRQQQTTEDVLAFVSDKKNRLLLPDQDIITALYGKQIQLADSYRYNLSDRILAMYNARHPNEIRSRTPASFTTAAKINHGSPDTSGNWVSFIRNFSKLKTTTEVQEHENTGRHV